jgi:hypothetical protein
VGEESDEEVDDKTSPVENSAINKDNREEQYCDENTLQQTSQLTVSARESAAILTAGYQGLLPDIRVKLLKLRSFLVKTGDRTAPEFLEEIDFDTMDFSLMCLGITLQNTKYAKMNTCLGILVDCFCATLEILFSKHTAGHVLLPGLDVSSLQTVQEYLLTIASKVDHRNNRVVSAFLMSQQIAQHSSLVSFFNQSGTVEELLSRHTPLLPLANIRDVFYAVRSFWTYAALVKSINDNDITQSSDIGIYRGNTDVKMWGAFTVLPPITRSDVRKTCYSMGSVSTYWNVSALRDGFMIELDESKRYVVIIMEKPIGYNQCRALQERLKVACEREKFVLQDAI